MDFSIEREHKRDRMLCHGMGRIRWDASNSQPELRRLSEVDIVVTGTPHQDQFDPLVFQHPQGLRIQRVVYKGADGVGAAFD